MTQQAFCLIGHSLVATIFRADEPFPPGLGFHLGVLTLLAEYNSFSFDDCSLRGKKEGLCGNLTHSWLVERRIFVQLNGYSWWNPKPGGKDGS